MCWHVLSRSMVAVKKGLAIGKRFIKYLSLWKMTL